jgi:hypothetical protein
MTIIYYRDVQTVAHELHAALGRFGCGSFLAVVYKKKYFEQIFMLDHNLNINTVDTKIRITD